MASLKSSLALAYALLAASCATATRVWSICKATVPPQPSPEEMAADVEVGSAVDCSLEYLFTELCDLDMAITVDNELTVAGSIYLGAMNRPRDSPDGSMEEAVECLPGSECYIICTTGSSVVELAQESADAPALVSSAQFLAGVKQTVPEQTSPQQVTTTCEAKFFSKQEMLAGAIFDVRKKFLIDQGMEDTSDQLACPYTGTDSRYLKEVTSLSVSRSSGLRGAQPDQTRKENCTSLKALAGIPVQDILKSFPILGFMIVDPAARTMSKSDRVFKKFPIHHLAWDSGVLSLTSYSGQEMTVNAKTGSATLTYAAKPQSARATVLGSRREDRFDADSICVHNVPREKLRHRANEKAMLQRQERFNCKGVDCNNFAGSVMTSGSFTMMASSDGD